MTNREKIHKNILNNLRVHEALSDEEFARSITLQGVWATVYREYARVLGYTGHWYEEERLTAWLGEEFKPAEHRYDGIGRR